MDDTASSATFSSRGNAKRAAEKMITAGTAPALDYGIKPRDGGRFEIVWKTAAKASPTTSEEETEIAAACEQAEATWSEAGEVEAARKTRERIGHVELQMQHTTGADGVRALLNGRAFEIAQLVASGRSNREVAAALFVSVKLVEKHLSSIYRKLGVRSRGQLAARLLSTVN